MINHFVNEYIKIIDKEIQKGSIGNELIIGSFIPVDSELDALTISIKIKEHYELNKVFSKITIGLPVSLYPCRVMPFYPFTSVDDFVDGPHMFKEPKKEGEPLLPNFVITPLLAFDKNLNRLGYGWSAYDNTFINFDSIKYLLAI